jgi:hypothetical protein
MLINRAKHVHSPHADFRELLAAARLGLLRAAARYDPQRVSGGKAPCLYALADRYIRMALRDMLTEVRYTGGRWLCHSCCLCAAAVGNASAVIKVYWQLCVDFRAWGALKVMVLLAYLMSQTYDTATKLQTHPLSSIP